VAEERYGTYAIYTVETKTEAKITPLECNMINTDACTKIEKRDLNRRKEIVEIKQDLNSVEDKHHRDEGM